MYRRALIYNPVAGRLRRNPQLLSRILGSLGNNVSPVPTSGPNSATALAREAVHRGVDQVIGFGGDGTLNEIANGLVGTSVPLAVLPGGTANVLAVELGLGTNPLTVAKNLDTLEPRRIAASRLVSHRESRYFLLMAGAGLDAHIVHTLKPSLKNLLGKAAYWLGGFGSVARRLPEFDLKIDGRSLRSSFALISRVRNYGGNLEIARGVRLTVPEFEVISFEGKWAPVYLKYFSGVLLNRLKGMEGVTVQRARHIELGPGAPLQVDGEAVGHSPAKIDIIPDALTLLMPARYGNDAWM